ncbi:MAG: winged helix-turn-helix transcriptional regulator [Thermoplasmatota archaeon]
MEAQGYRDHDTRRLLYEYIRDNPGATYRMLKKAFKLTDGTLRYHLDYLQRKRKVVQEKSGREKCYFSYLKKRFPFSDPDLHLNEAQEKLLDIISRDPGLSIGDLRRRSGMKRESFQYNLRKLKKLKLVWRVKGIEGSGYEIVTRERLADEMFLLTVNRFLDGKIEKEEMMSIIERLKDYREDVR